MKLKKLIASVVATVLVGTTMAVASITTVSADTIGHAWLIMQDGGGDNVTGVANWNMTDAAGYIDITGNGNYTLSFDIPEGCGAEQIDFLGISTDINIYQQDANEQEIYDEMTFDISSIVVDGTTIQYSKSASADSTNDDGTTYRLSIYDTWSGRNIQDIDNVVACATNITINFTVSGIKGSEDTSDETTTTTTTTTTSDDDETTTTTTSSDDDDDDSDSTTTVSEEDTTSATGDVGVAGVVLVCALTGAGIVATRKRD
ncbi:MAG: hypothetical protein LUG94_08175 [Ruminococcus sp.]|nr:hypothetical protein [Ruminococcus sp.]